MGKISELLIVLNRVLVFKFNQELAKNWRNCLSKCDPDKNIDPTQQGKVILEVNYLLNNKDDLKK